METKHTPGPWEVHQGNDYTVVLRPDDTTDYAIHIPDGDIADARLISAAPDLLAALEGLRERLRDHIKFNVRKHASLMIADVAADNAIRKARGLA